jgi:hypothetical protein
MSDSNKINSPDSNNTNVVVAADEAASSTSAQSSWFGSLWQSVKTQSEAVLDIYKRDLTEFSNTIAHDTQAVAQRELAEADGSVSKTVHSKLSSAVSSISSVISSVVEGGGDDDAVAKPVSAAAAAAVSESASAAADLTDDSAELSESFYRSDPTVPDDLALFRAWKESTLVLGDKTDEISRVLAEKEHVRSFHAKLVPDSVPYRDFWARYFYRVHKLALAKQRRDELVRRVSAAASGAAQSAEELKWDDDEADDTAAVADAAPAGEPAAPSTTVDAAVVPETPPQAPPVPAVAAPVVPTPAPAPAAVVAAPAKPAAGEEDWGDWE